MFYAGPGIQSFVYLRSLASVMNLLCFEISPYCMVMFSIHLNTFQFSENRTVTKHSRGSPLRGLNRYEDRASD